MDETRYLSESPSKDENTSVEPWVPLHPQVHVMTALDYLAVLRRRQRMFWGVLVLVLTLGYLGVRSIRPNYRAEAKVRVPGVPSIPKSTSPEENISPISALLASAKPISVSAQMQQLESNSFIVSVMQRIGQKVETGIPRVEVDLPQNSDVLEIAVQDENAEKAADLANGLAVTHVTRMRQIATHGLEEAIAYLNSELGTLNKKLSRANNRLAAFAEKHPLKRLSAVQEGAITRMVQLQARLGEAKSEAQSQRAQLQRVRAKLAAEPENRVVKQEKDNPHRDLLFQKVGELNIQRIQLLEDFLPDAPQVRSVEEQIASLNEQLKREPATFRVETAVPNPLRTALEEKAGTLLLGLLAQKEAYRVTLAALNAAKARPEFQSDAVTPQQVRAADLTIRRDRLQKQSDRLADYLDDLRLRKHSWGEAPLVIDRAALPSDPVGPSSLALMSLVGSVALLLALGSVFLHEHLDDRVVSVRDIQRDLGVPVLGIVPRFPIHVDGQHGLVIGDPVLRESYCGLRTSIRFASQTTPLQLLQVTSPSPGDGKTTTAVNLAATLARERRVLLVDADLRRPRVHQILWLSRTGGLADVLMGNLPLRKAIRDTDVPNLRVICAGEAIGNPSELLGSPAFGEVLNALKAEAEVVVIDSPACLPISDALIIAERMDGVILVVGTGRTRRGNVEEALHQLRRASANVLGTFVSRAPVCRGLNYYSYYGGQDRNSQLPSVPPA